MRFLHPFSRAHACAGMTKGNRNDKRKLKYLPKEKSSQWCIDDAQLMVYPKHRRQ